MILALAVAAKNIKNAAELKIAEGNFSLELRVESLEF